jgi:hypothetical protein
LIASRGFDGCPYVNRPFNCDLLSSSLSSALSKAVALTPSHLDGAVETEQERPAIR